MDVPDDGYRHIARCTQLEDLILMYCRETTDAATQHISTLPGLKRYFASYNKITDRSLEILGRMKSLERIELCSVPGVTNVGLAFLANLPRLRQLTLSELPNVTREAVAVFPSSVRIEYSV
jgi:Leucine-rich repeat (LRR) protein